MDQDPKHISFKNGNKIQDVVAKLLHSEANVPLGPCGYVELSCFALTPSLFNNQIALVDADRAYFVSAFGPPLGKPLVLLHEKGNYDVITSLQGFFGTSYVCAHHFKPYNTM